LYQFTLGTAWDTRTAVYDSGEQIDAYFGDAGRPGGVYKPPGRQELYISQHTPSIASKFRWLGEQAEQPLQGVVVQLPFDGTDGDTFTTDVKGNVITMSGGAVIDDAQSKFGGTSFNCLGPTTFEASVLQAGGLETSDFTIEFWYYPSGAAAASDRLFQTIDGDVVAGIYISHAAAGTIQFGLEFTPYSGGFDYLGPAVAITNNVWQHICLEREVDDFTLYIDGVSQDTATVGAESGIIALGPIDLCTIGAQASGRANNGWIDDFRISNIAQYGGNFTPPGSAHPIS